MFGLVCSHSNIGTRFCFFKELLLSAGAAGVQSLKILESEGNKETEDDKFNRVDILVENRKGELVIVEIQNTREADYFQRMLYGMAKVIDPLMQAGFAKGLIFARMAGSKMRLNPHCNQPMGGRKDYEIAVPKNGEAGLETGSFR